MPLSLSLHVSVCLSAPPPPPSLSSLSLSISVCPSICPSVSSISPSLPSSPLSLSDFLSVCLSFCLSFCLSVCLSLSLSYFLFHPNLFNLRFFFVLRKTEKKSKKVWALGRLPFCRKISGLCNEFLAERLQCIKTFNIGKETIEKNEQTFLFVSSWQQLQINENTISQGRHIKPDLRVTRVTIHWRNGSISVPPTTMAV